MYCTHRHYSNIVPQGLSGRRIISPVMKFPTFTEDRGPSRAAKMFSNSILSWSRPGKLAQHQRLQRHDMQKNIYSIYINTRLILPQSNQYPSVKINLSKRGDTSGRGGGAQIFHFLWKHRISHCGTGYQFCNFRPQTNENSETKIISFRIWSKKYE
jgi:hypothetical protein